MRDSPVMIARSRDDDNIKERNPRENVRSLHLSIITAVCHNFVTVVTLETHTK